MLEVDLKAADQRVAQLVAENCAQFGRVASVKVHRAPSAFALVEMTTREQTNALASTFGSSTFGNCVLVHLREKTALESPGVQPFPRALIRRPPAPQGRGCRT